MGARRQGERAGLSRDLVLDAAIELADREGLTALSMRGLATALGVEAMTLYHYVPNKQALLDGMVDRVVVAAVPPVRTGGAWQDTLRRSALDLRAGLRAHPSVTPLLASRPVLGGGTAEFVEGLLSMLTDAGFAPDEALRAVQAVAALVVGQVVTEGDDSPVASPGPAVDGSSYPLLEDAVRTGGADPQERFGFALDALLAGIAGTRDTPD